MNALVLPRRTAQRLHRSVEVLSWGAFKIGRNEGIKYPDPYDLPTPEQATALVRGVLALGIHAIDTAPAYGLSEERIGRALETLPAHAREELFLGTKVGESFEQGRSTHDFSAAATEASLERSHRLLGRDRIDLVWVHSDGRDEALVADGAALGVLAAHKARGTIGSVGFSAKSPSGARAALEDPRVDALMLEFHPRLPQMAQVIADAADAGRAVFVKKPLASGTLDPTHAIPWILGHRGVTAVVVGGLSLDRLRANALLAAGAGPAATAAERPAR